MPELHVAVPLALFVGLVALFLYVLRRAAVVVADTREIDAFRRDAAALTDRSAATIAASAERIDRVRRRQDAPASLDDLLPADLEQLAGLRVEAETLAPPANLAPLRGRIADELDRAARAVETVEHGRSLLSSLQGRPSEMEGETSIKRGYLNLMHAREALVSLGIDLRSGRTDSHRWYSDRPRQG